MDYTPPKISPMTDRELMALSGSERMVIASRMFDAERAMVLASFPPGLSEIETKRRLCEHFYGDEVDVDKFVEYLRARESAHSHQAIDNGQRTTDH